MAHPHRRVRFLQMDSGRRIRTTLATISSRRYQIILFILVNCFFVLDFGLLLDHCFVLIVVLIVMVWLGLYWILQWEHLFNYFCRFWIYNLSVFLIDKCHSVMVSDISCYLFICCPLNNICHLFELKVNMDDTFLAGAMNYQQWITQTSKWI